MSNIEKFLAVTLYEVETVLIPENCALVYINGYLYHIDANDLNNVEYIKQ
jgi:hypothetical protein